MQRRDGFIADVFLYCDDWCAKCPVSDRCLAFNDAAAGIERHLELVRVESPHLTIVRRKIQDQAFAYRAALHQWLRAGDWRLVIALGHDMDRLLWDASVIASRTSRALIECSRRERTGIHPDGLAKAALLSIDTSVQAWDGLQAHPHVDGHTARRFSSELQRLARAVHAAFPRARDFVRPGFDAPAAT